MKFCDKLQKIRKENNLTQEALADRLDVSRQAVSKWESGTAYPDTEKLIQISQIFNVSLDELINDNKEVNKANNNRKLNFKETLNVCFNFVENIFSMFFAMKFSEKFKFLLEMLGLIVIIYFISILSMNIVEEILRHIFIFLPYRIINGIIMFFDTILYIVCLIVGGIAFVRIIKKRYLDYYVIIKDDSVSETTVEEPIRELKEKKDYKIVIRDPEHSSYNILKKIGKIFIFFLKIFGLLLLLPIVIGFIGLVVGLVVSLSFLFSGLFFNGISLSILGCIGIAYLAIEFIFKLIFNQKISFKKLFLIFIAGIILVGVGIGVSIIDFGNFEMVQVNDKRKEEIKIDCVDNLIIDDLNKVSDDKVVIDNNLDYIKMDIMVNEKCEPVVHYYDSYNRETEQMFRVVDIYATYDGFNNVKEAIDLLKKKKIEFVGDDTPTYEIEKIYISGDNLTRIKENYKKRYE